MNFARKKNHDATGIRWSMHPAAAFTAGGVSSNWIAHCVGLTIHPTLTESEHFQKDGLTQSVSISLFS
jgi:hypothetical protein